VLGIYSSYWSDGLLNQVFTDKWATDLDKSDMDYRMQVF
jgi:hypothetical protein